MSHFDAYDTWIEFCSIKMKKGSQAYEKITSLSLLNLHED